MDDDGCGIVTFALGAAIVITIAVCALFGLALVAVAAVPAGCLYGGVLSCRNYVLSFKRNIVDSNRQVTDFV